MPLLMCPNDDAAMQTLERNGVQFDMCPACRGVWLDRGELEKLMSAARRRGACRRRAADTRARPASLCAAASGSAVGPEPAPIATNDTGDDRHRDGDYRHKKKKRDSIFDIFD